MTLRHMGLSDHETKGETTVQLSVGQVEEPASIKLFHEDVVDPIDLDLVDSGGSETEADSR